MVHHPLSRPTLNEDERGQAMVEAAVCLPLLMLLLAAMLFFGHVGIGRLETTMAARHAAWSAMRGNVQGSGDAQALINQAFPARFGQATVEIHEGGLGPDAFSQTNQSLGTQIGQAMPGGGVGGIAGTLDGALANLSGRHGALVTSQFGAAGFADRSEATQVTLGEVHYVDGVDWTMDDLYGQELLLVQEGILAIWNLSISGSLF